MKKINHSRHLKVQITIGYTLVALLMCGVIYIWHEEWYDIKQREEEYRYINHLRQEVNSIHMQLIELSPSGETMFIWNAADVNNTRLKLESRISHLHKIFYSASSRPIGQIKYSLI